MLKNLSNVVKKYTTEKNSNNSLNKNNEEISINVNTYFFKIDYNFSEILFNNLLQFSINGQEHILSDIKENMVNNKFEIILKKKNVNDSIEIPMLNNQLRLTIEMTINIYNEKTLLRKSTIVIYNCNDFISKFPMDKEVHLINDYQYIGIPTLEFANDTLSISENNKSYSMKSGSFLDQFIKLLQCRENVLDMTNIINQIRICNKN